MFRKLIPGMLALCGVAAIAITAVAADYSPTQTQLNDLTFVDFWPMNGATLTSKSNAGSDGVKFTFNTGFSSPTPDAFSRTQFQAPFTQDLSTFNAFDIDFQQNTSINGHQLQAQVNLNYTGGSGTSRSGWIPFNAAGRTTVSLPLSTVPAASRNQITSYQIELRSDDPFDADVGDVVTGFTSPQPPTFSETTLFGFEGTGSGSLEGWGTSFQPDHTHLVVSNAVQNPDRAPNNGVTQGTHALEIHRNHTGQVFTGAGTNFRWGSQVSLNASTPANGDYNGDNTVNAADYTRWRDNFGSTTANLPNDPTPTVVDNSDFTTWKNNFGQAGGTNPTVQAQIHNLVTQINAGDQIAFDVSFKNLDDFPLAYDIPSFLGYHMFIQDGSGAFYQGNDTLAFNAGIPAAGDSYTFSMILPLSTFTDRSANGFGSIFAHKLMETGTFTMGLASNVGINANMSIPEIATQAQADAIAFGVDFDIDNIRVRKQNPGAGLGGGTVPEPSSMVLAAVGIVIGWSVRRRQAQ